jgi:hypothetical protein
VFDVLRGDCRHVSSVKIIRRFVETCRLHVKAKSKVRLKRFKWCVCAVCRSCDFVSDCTPRLLLLAFSRNNLASYISFAQPVWRGESPGNGSWGNYRTSFWFWGFWWRCDINTRFFCVVSIVYCTVQLEQAFPKPALLPPSGDSTTLASDFVGLSKACSRVNVFSGPTHLMMEEKPASETLCFSCAVDDRQCRRGLFLEMFLGKKVSEFSSKLHSSFNFQRL